MAHKDVTFTGVIGEKPKPKAVKKVSKKKVEEDKE